MAINVSGWLQELGLERYEEAFRDNDVDGDVLPDRTAEDLIGIGVTSIGHRTKLLAAIAAIGPDVSAVAVATTPAPTLTSAPAAEPASSRAAPLSPWQ
jgi:SAM (Sterile alpha motif) domain-containing protein